MFDTVDGIGGHGDGPLGLLVSGVAYVDDLEALAGPHLYLMVDLGDQWTDSVDGIAADLLGPPDHFRGRPMG